MIKGKIKILNPTMRVARGNVLWYFLHFTAIKISQETPVRDHEKRKKRKKKRERVRRNLFT